MSMLQVEILGEPAIHWAGCELQTPNGQIRALLFRLAAQCEPLPIEHIGFLFWSGQSTEYRKRNAVRLCNRLQRQLPTDNALVIEDDDVALNSSVVWSDAIVFRQLAEDYNHTHRTMILTALVELYKGPFLDGFSLPGCVAYNSWITLARRLWARDYLTAMQTLVEQSMVVGDFEKAINVAQRYLAENPTEETIYRHLIELHGLCGDQPAAHKQYEVCTDVLRRDRGRSPGEVTTRAYQSAMAGSLDHKEIVSKFVSHLEFADHQTGRRRWQHEPKPRRQKILLF